MLYPLNNNITFPNVNNASIEGLLAVGGDLSVERLLLAYKSGIFPWFEKNQPILWWSPDPRFVLFPKKLKVSKSMKQVLRKQKFNVTVNENFRAVIEAAALTKRKAQNGGTWITNSMIKAYSNLHEMGYAKSIEVWEDEKLVGGLYGIDLGNGIFCGESMFSKVSNASKVGFITFVKNSKYKLIDCQVYTKHLESLGGEELPRNTFLKILQEGNV